MTRLRVNCFGVSIDGYGAGPNQAFDHPLGVGGSKLHQWQFETRTFRNVAGGEGDGTGVDDRFVARGFDRVGAWILGRNMFGPIRGPWPDESWRGWWGEEPPYRTPVFVLTHHARAPLTMKGGTVFHFVTGGADEALRLATEAAGHLDVRVGGGPATIRQYLRAGRIDELHLALAPVLLGTGEPLLADLDLPALGYECTEFVPGENATHFVLAKRA